MIRKLLFALSAIILGIGNVDMTASGPAFSIESAAHALGPEAHPDPGCTGIGSPTLDTGATISGGKCNFSNVGGMKGIAWSAPIVKEGHTYRGQATVSGRTQGKVRVMFVDMSTAASYTALPSPTLDGLAPIEGNGTVTQGTDPAAIAGDMGEDPMGSFRMECFAGPVLPIDPEIYPGQKARSHAHSFVGGTGVTTTSTYAHLRNHGGTTCGTEQQYPVNTSLYWQPSVFDGQGNIYRSFVHQLYYKRQPESSPACTDDGNAYFEGICVGLPNGIRFIFGYNMSTGLGGPLDDDSGGPAIIKYGCADRNQVAYDIDPVTPGLQAQSTHLNDLFGGNCPLGYIWNIQATAPNCWDGANLDSVTHRTHLVVPSVWNGTVTRCDASHPYWIPDFQYSAFYIVDNAFVNGKTHLSSDEMVHGAEPGATMHVDYFEAWKPSFKLRWYTNCINNHLTCSSGADGIGRAIKGDSGWPAVPLANVYQSVSAIGLGPDMAANGTYTWEFTARVSGKIMLVGLDDLSGNGFTGSVDDISIKEITAGRQGPATVTPTGAMAANDNLSIPANDNHLNGVLPIRFNLKALR